MSPDPDYAKAQLKLRLASLEITIGQVADNVQEILAAGEDLRGLQDQQMRLSRLQKRIRWVVQVFCQGPERRARKPTARQPRVDLAGKKFGKWEVLESVGGSRWKCRCHGCNEVYIRDGYSLQRGETKRCYKCAARKRAGRAYKERRRKAPIGRIYALWRVEGMARLRSHKDHDRWRVRCLAGCDRVLERAVASVKLGKTRCCQECFIKLGKAEVRRLIKEGGVRG